MYGLTVVQRGDAFGIPSFALGSATQIVIVPPPAAYVGVYTDMASGEAYVNDTPLAMSGRGHTSGRVHSAA